MNNPTPISSLDLWLRRLTRVAGVLLLLVVAGVLWRVSELIVSVRESVDRVAMRVDAVGADVERVSGAAGGVADRVADLTQKVDALDAKLAIKERLDAAKDPVVWMNRLDRWTGGGEQEREREAQPVAEPTGEAWKEATEVAIAGSQSEGGEVVPSIFGSANGVVKPGLTGPPQYSWPFGPAATGLIYVGIEGAPKAWRAARWVDRQLEPAPPPSANVSSTPTPVQTPASEAAQVQPETEAAPPPPPPPPATDLATLLRDLASSDLTFRKGEGEGGEVESAAQFSLQAYAKYRGLKRFRRSDDTILHAVSHTLRGEPYFVVHPDGTAQPLREYLDARLAGPEEDGEE